MAPEAASSVVGSVAGLVVNGVGACSSSPSCSSRTCGCAGSGSRRPAPVRAEHRGGDARLPALPGGRRMGRRFHPELDHSVRPVLAELVELALAERLPAGEIPGRAPRNCWGRSCGPWSTVTCSARRTGRRPGPAGGAAANSGESGATVSTHGAAGTTDSAADSAVANEVADRTATGWTRSNAWSWEAPRAGADHVRGAGRAHVLIEDLPGLGKALIARSFAAALGLESAGVQFTPDLLPADLTGTTVLDQASVSSSSPGPVFANLLLADEIQPDAAEDPGRAAGGDGRGTGQRRRVLAPAAPAVRRARDPTTPSSTRHLPAAGGAAGTASACGCGSVTLPAADEVECSAGGQPRRHEPTVRQVLDAETLLRMRAGGGVVSVEPDVLDYVVRIARGHSRRQRRCWSAAVRGPRSRCCSWPGRAPCWTAGTT